MKKVLLIALAVVGVAFTSCNKTTDPINGADDKTAIQLSADILNVGTPANVATKIDGTTFPKNLTPAFAVTAFKDAVPTAYAGAYFSNKDVNSDASAKLTFAAAEYYPGDGKDLFFYAFAPAGPLVTYTEGSTNITPKAAYTITGKEDLLWAKEITPGHNKANAAAAVKFNFSHMLKQVKFTIKGTDAYVATGRQLQSIKIVSAKNKAALDVVTGALVFDATSTASLTSFNGPAMAVTTSPVAVPGSVMFEAGASFNIEVVVANSSENLRGPVNLGALTGNGSAGYSYTVNVQLDVTGEKIVVDATIADWIDGGSTDIPLM